MPGPTITVRGEGGAISQIDVPDEGTVARELFDDHLAKGRYTVVEGDWPPADDGEPAEGDGEPSVPAKSAKVGVWREYASSVDPDNADDIAKMPKDALVERYGTDDHPTGDDGESGDGEDEGGEG